ncbi:DUF2127 domain-containing protein [Psychrobacter sp. I-STPA6b]|uniref:DUF2127 domain-containing protein n=1 Tax=Psychrobacter sp. I-STPA6b TaxID=2585718 RepID=UPI001D0C52FE|nr:DUF2127 domain-containing protein [Psychrobacter sp. I-STPA6b]
MSKSSNSASSKPNDSKSSESEQKQIAESENKRSLVVESSTAMAIKDEEDGAQASKSIKMVAIYELLKGVGALFGAVALWLWHQNINSWLMSLSNTWHYYFGQLLLNQVNEVIHLAENASRHWLAGVVLIVGYASIRFLEAYGLWKDKIWAYWFSVLGYGLFIPIELYYLITGVFDWFKLAIFVLNVVIVIVVYRNMKRKGLI